MVRNCEWKLTSWDGFHDASKMMTRLAATKLIPNPPARVEIKNNLKISGKNKLCINQEIIKAEGGTFAT